MARSRRSARDAGARFERQVADYLAEALGDERVDRMVRRGANDRGDITGVRIHGKPLALECKNVTRMSLSEWIDEAHREAGNADALAGLVVCKRHGVGDPGSQWFFGELRDLVAVILGETQEGCYGL